MTSPSSKRNIPKWIIIGCGALAAIAALCISLSIIISGIPSPETPTPTKIAISTEIPTDTPTPQPTEPPTVTPTPEQFITIDGYDPHSESIIDPINLWIDYNDRAAGIAAKAHHGDRVKLIKREDDGILVETTAGVQGWVTYWFVKEFKDEYLAMITATPTSPPVVGIGQRVEKAGIALTINEVRRELELSEFMKANEGNVFLIVDLTIENADRDESTPYNPLYCKVKDADGFEYMASIFGTDKGLKSGELTKGDIARGEIAFEVPTGASGFIFSYEPLVLFGGYEPIKVRLE